MRSASADPRRRLVDVPPVRLINPEGIATSAMSELPMSLIPTFAVPLFVVLHLICIAQARRWEKPIHSRIGDQLPSSAV